MKSQQFVWRAVVLAAVVVLFTAEPGCKKGPVDWNAFNEQTIEENLAAIDSAGSLYQAQLAAGDIDAGAQQAQAFLLAQPGVGTVRIAPDSTVWAFFTSGLAAGVGDVRRDTTSSLGAAPTTAPRVRTQGGGEVGDYAHYILPFDIELPGTQRAANAIRGIFERRLNWDNSETYKGATVDFGIALGEIDPGTSVLFWSGHGFLFTRDNDGQAMPGLVLGKQYARRAMASAAVTQYAGYLNPGPGQQRQAAVVQFVGDPGFSIVILPAFIRAYGNFNVSETLPYVNNCKTIVYLSDCYSAYGVGGTGELVQAFLDAGADLVCGYSWAVGDPWSCGKDSAFFKAMADTCLPWEAVAEMGNLIDPDPGRQGFHAQFQMFGDSMVLLRAVFQAEKGGTLLRPGITTAVRSSTSSGISAYLHPDGSTEDAGYLSVTFPGNSPGTFDCATMENANIMWMDMAAGRFYYAMKGFVGVSGTIEADRCRSDAITGHFSGTLGWWDAGLDPTQDPPSGTVTFENGIFRYTGKIMQTDFGPQPLPVTGTQP